MLSLGIAKIFAAKEEPLRFTISARLGGAAMPAG